MLVRTERSVKGEPDTKQFENKNYRFSAYRSMFFWLDKKKGSKKYRKALPACLGMVFWLKITMFFISMFSVTHVRNLYPDDEYRGFQPSSPVIRNKRKRK